ncbi:hypothetical protein A0H81_04141 [Grifola frondosa]|uniref:Uncharacterized protein n=1 Tax=Grifola frondosa TaxID=5627 RepID=A0A1C7MLG7_GRIFR|nr:hypothetical protein A0H81_04141 [Grifola frondosa]
MPNLILMPDPKEREPSSSSTVPELQRIPLAMDLALHATPAVSLIIDFLAFETKYSRKVSRYGATILAVLAGGSYAYWTEHCAAFNGTFPYPFLTYNPFHIRVVIYAGVTGLALASFWILNALHA